MGKLIAKWDWPCEEAENCGIEEVCEPLVLVLSYLCHNPKSKPRVRVQKRLEAAAVKPAAGITLETF